MEQIRSFIAIELPADVRSALAELQAGLRTNNPPQVKWVDPDSIHLTLKFLGNIPAAKINDIGDALVQVARDFSPLSLEVQGLGVFPDFRRVRVVWVSLGGDISQLKQLQQRIDSSLMPLGFARESRPFTPHLTLARVRERATPAEQQQLGQIISDARFKTTHRFTAESISLMQSQLTTGGAIYRQITAVGLK
jgi:2'-5' RNA ligase